MKHPSKRYMAVVTLLWVTLSAHAFAFRCDGKIISKSSHTGDVARLCGEPQSKRRYTDYRIIGVNLKIPANVYIRI